MAMALDVDVIKHSLGRWQTDMPAAGLQARRLALALVRQHLNDGYDVVMGQYLARASFIGQLEQVAAETVARFIEVALVVDEVTLARRLGARRAQPSRPEHSANDKLVSPSDAKTLLRSIELLCRQRRSIIPVEASGSVGEVALRVRALIAAE